MAKVLAISSHVLRGHVGLDATVPALQHLGHEVWALPTIMLPSRPGLGRLLKRPTPIADLADILAALDADGCWQRLDGVLTGYFPSPECVATVALAIAGIKTARPGIPVLVDPVLGDAGSLYVDTAIAEAIRDALLPLATIATPNLFELGWLTATSPRSADEAAEAARRLCATTIVTSAPIGGLGVATLLVTQDSRVERETPRKAQIPNGAGDLFAGLILGNLLNGGSSEAALDASLSILDRVLAASSGQEVLKLSSLHGVRP